MGLKQLRHLVRIQQVGLASPLPGGSPYATSGVGLRLDYDAGLRCPFPRTQPYFHDFSVAGRHLDFVGDRIIWYQKCTYKMKGD